MTNKKENDAQRTMREFKERFDANEQERKDKRIAKRHKEDEDSMNAVQWTDWDFRG